MTTPHRQSGRGTNMQVSNISFFWPTPLTTHQLFLVYRQIMTWGWQLLVDWADRLQQPMEDIFLFLQFIQRVCLSHRRLRQCCSDLTDYCLCSVCFLFLYFLFTSHGSPLLFLHTIVVAYKDRVVTDGSDGKEYEQGEVQFLFHLPYMWLINMILTPLFSLYLTQCLHIWGWMCAEAGRRLEWTESRIHGA